MVDRTDQLDTADTAVKSEDTAVLAADDVDVDDTAAAAVCEVKNNPCSFRILSDDLTLDLDADVGADC